MAILKPRPISWLNGRIVDESGKATPELFRFIRDLVSKTDPTLTQVGQFNSSAPVQGRSEGVGVTVQQLTNTGLLTDADKVAADGATFGRTSVDALNANRVDLSKVGVIGPLGSAKINQNVMNNYSNNATVDSIDNGVNATIRVYGPGGPGTTWHQFIGSTVGPEIASFSGTAPYSVDRNVYFDGVSFFISANGSDTLPDGILFSGSLHTVAAGGAGGTGGGGGAGGGGGGSQRKAF